MKILKKMILLSVVLYTTVFGLFAQDNYLDSIPEVIRYEINDDYESFEKYVKSKGSLIVKTKRGMDIVLGTAYFSDNNFAKACKLLKSKRVNLDIPNKDNMTLLHYICGVSNTKKFEELIKYNPQFDRKIISINYTPAEMTQYRTFLYYENQDLGDSTDAFVDTYNIKKTLSDKTKKEFTYSNLTFGNIGHLSLVIYNTVAAFFPKITTNELLDTPLMNIYKRDYQPMATVTKQKLENFYLKWFPESELTEVTESEKIKEALKNCTESESPYIIIANTGNNPVAPYYWGTINGIYNTGETIENDSFIELGGVDENLSVLEYQVKDISLLLILKINE